MTIFGSKGVSGSNVKNYKWRIEYGKQYVANFEILLKNCIGFYMKSRQKGFEEIWRFNALFAGKKIHFNVTCFSPVTGITKWLEKVSQITGSS